MHLKDVMYIHNCYIDTREFGPAVSWKTTGEFFLLFPHDLLHLMSQHKAKLSILSIFQHSSACVQLRKEKKQQLSPENQREGDHLRAKTNQKKRQKIYFISIKSQLTFI